MKTEILNIERDRATEALREAEQSYRRLLEATTDYVYTVDLNHGQTSTTRYGLGCEAITGYSTKAYETDPYLWYRIIYEEDRAAVLRQIDKILQGESTLPIEHRIIHRDGSLRWIRNTTIPHHNASGELIGYDGLITDITERKRWEGALESERNLLRTLVDNLPDYIFVKDTASRFILDNLSHAHALGAENVSQVLGKTDADFLTPAQASQNRLAEEDVFASGLPQYNIEESSIDVSGNQRWFSVTRVPLKGPQGKVTGLVGIKHDITSRKRAEQTLHETQDQLIQAARFESIGTLASGVAHEVKNPLQTILMGVSFLSRKLQNPDESISKSLKDMEESVSRADSIISELLALSRVSEFQLERGDLNPIIRQSLRLINCKLDAAGVAVVLHLAADLPRPLLNVFKLEQVFIILFLNAIHAMPSGGTLTVTTRVAVLDQALAAIGPMFQKFQAGQRLVVGEVRDTGTGIPDWAQKRLFEPFFTTKPAGVGTGLGLFVARRIVERHSGAIALQNTPDGGALATVALKLDPED